MGKRKEGKKVSKSLVTREFSSGGVVFKKEGKDVLWFVRKTAASALYPKQYWMLPKGRIDDTKDNEPGPMALGKIKADEVSLQKTAVREVAEEGGIEAKIIQKIETIMYSFIHPKRGKMLKFATFYLMEWIRNLPEGFDSETSEILWLPFDEAYKKLTFSGEKEALKKGKEILLSLI